jgi:hypothetical protein
MSWLWGRRYSRHRPKSFDTLKRWAAARAHHSLMATLGIVYATLVALRPEHPPPAPARALHDPSEPEPLMTPMFRLTLTVLAAAAFAVFVLVNL